MKPSVIVWDLETVPDLAGFAAANDLVGKSDADIRAALGNKFPKHIYHTIVCIGALVRDERFEVQRQLRREARLGRSCAR
jgi:3'-5' exonuclease